MVYYIIKIFKKFGNFPWRATIVNKCVGVSKFLKPRENIGRSVFAIKKDFILMMEFCKLYVNGHTTI